MIIFLCHQSIPARSKCLIATFRSIFERFNTQQLLFISLLLGNKLPDMFWKINILSFTQNAKIACLTILSLR